MLAFQVVSVSVEVICRYLLYISFSVVTPLNEWNLVYLTFWAWHGCNARAATPAIIRGGFCRRG